MLRGVCVCVIALHDLRSRAVDLYRHTAETRWFLALALASTTPLPFRQTKSGGQQCGDLGLPRDRHGWWD